MFGTRFFGWSGGGGGGGTITGGGTPDFFPIFTGATAIGDSSWKQTAGNLLPTVGTETIGTSGVRVANIFSLKVDIDSGGAATASLIDKANTVGSISEFLGSGTPEGAITGFKGDWYTDVATGDKYTKTTDGVVTGWTKLDSVASDDWNLDGNSNGSLRYIGTNNAFDFPIYTSGTEKARFFTSGELVINSTSAAVLGEKLVVTNTFDSYFTGLVDTGVTTALYTYLGTGPAGTSSAQIGTETDSGMMMYASQGGAHNNYLYLANDATGTNRYAGFHTGAPTAALHVVGQGTTSATSALKVDNASASILNIKNDKTSSFKGGIGVGAVDGFPTVGLIMIDSTFIIGNLVALSSTGVSVAGYVAALTGAATTNTAMSISSSGATNNYALVTTGGRSVMGAATSDASALLEMVSTTQGFLPPRMTEVQRDAIVLPAKGLVIYNTDTDQWEGNSGTAGTPSWSILG